MANTSAFVLSKNSQDSFIQYYRESLLTVNSVKSSQRNRFEEIDRAYMRENDTTDTATQSKLANFAGNADKLQNITVPVVMPQVEAAVVYQTSVFLTGIPIFGVVSSPEMMDTALQMETILDENSRHGGWTRQLMMFFRNGAKYNFAPLEVTWEKEVVAGIDTDVNFSVDQGKPTEVIWSGNVLNSLDPYNTFVDPRVPPAEVYKRGEFAGHTDFLSRIELKEFVAKMSDSLTMNITRAFESQSTGIPGSTAGETVDSFYIPNINPQVVVRDQYEGNMNWMSWAGITNGQAGKNAAIQYKNTYEKTVLYCKILPSEFALNVPAKNTPQIWKLIIINHQVIISAERQTNAHNFIPILIGVPNEDGLDYQTKSLAKNGIVFQEVVTAYMNSIIASRRRAISDRVLYDPSRITSAVMNSSNPSAKMPVRPSAFGKNISDAVYQFPYREDQAATSMAQIRDLLSMANQLNGQNPARQGQFVKGNKTKSEFDEVMTNSNGRDQLVSILYEDQVFTPMKLIFKINILQFQGGKAIYSREQEREVQIDPVQLRNSVLEFKITDGLVPADKIIAGDTLGTAIQVLGSSPQLGAAYNIGPMFSYLMKTQGANIGSFEKSPEQVAYEQAVQQWGGMMTLAIEKGMDEGQQANFPPQPLPEQFGYVPAGQGQSAIEDKSDRGGERLPGQEPP